ncbi:MAG: ABC transporter substrate-binding protein [Mariniblastus sp.]|nr:ABC transporter substrate-binding protein [Mariniblastus sp.]
MNWPDWISLPAQSTKLGSLSRRVVMLWIMFGLVVAIGNRAVAWQGNAAAKPSASGVDETKYFDDSLPLVDREPYDELKLDDYNNNVVIKIIPLQNPPSMPLPENGFLQFEAPDLNENILQVPYENIVSYRTFIQLLIDEANELIKAEKYAQAYRNLLYVYDRGGKGDPAIEKSIQNCLYQDGRLNYLAGNYELAISIFEEIYARDPNFIGAGFNKKPIDVILDSIDSNIKKKFEAGQYDKVTATLDQIQDLYGKESLRLTDRWNGILLKHSNELIAEAKKLMAENKGKEAHLKARQANRVIPERDEALQVYEEIVSRFPIVFVGVTNDSAGADPLRLDLWGGRRIGRLTMRSVVEFSGMSDDGGSYKFLNGKLEQADEDGLAYRFTIEPTDPSEGIPDISALDLASKMVAMGTYEMPDYRTAFAKVIDTVEIEDDRNVLIKLRRQFVRPEALVQFRYDNAFDGQPPVQNGKYVMTSKNDQIAVFGRNPSYPAQTDQQHPEIVEWTFKNPSDAVDAIAGGEVDLIDRVPLAELPRLQGNAAVQVQSYIVPTVHMLIPNIRNDFTRDKNFRNGLLRGINRELILETMICGGNDIDGCDVISGPFPRGTLENDQLAYGYNTRVRPEPFNQKLGMVLVQTVQQTMIDALVAKGDKNPVVKRPTLILCHTRDDIPKIACVAIQRMWGELGIKVELRELEPGQTVPPDDDWDFLYYEMSMQEPLTDVDKLFGEEGLVKELSAPVLQSMRRLGYADSWQVAGLTLRRMHRQIRNDVTVLPLWQLKEHYAFRDNLREVGRNAVHLYQNVDRWKITPRQKKAEKK